jgi:hypothetical protein
MVIGLDTMRSDRKYCVHAKAACRQRAYRQRLGQFAADR